MATLLLIPPNLLILTLDIQTHPEVRCFMYFGGAPNISSQPVFGCLGQWNMYQMFQGREYLPSHFPLWKCIAIFQICVNFNERFPTTAVQPRKTKMEPWIHQLEKENHLPNLHDFGFKMLIFPGCKLPLPSPQMKFFSRNIKALAHSSCSCAALLLDAKAQADEVGPLGNASKVTRCLLLPSKREMFFDGIKCVDESLVLSMAVVLGWYTFKMLYMFSKN